MTSKRFNITENSNSAITLFDRITGNEYRVSSCVEELCRECIKKGVFEWNLHKDQLHLTVKAWSLAPKEEYDEEEEYYIYCHNTKMDMEINPNGLLTDQVNDMLFALRDKVRKLTEENDKLKCKVLTLEQEDMRRAMLSCLDRDLFENEENETI